MTHRHRLTKGSVSYIYSIAHIYQIRIYMHPDIYQSRTLSFIV